MKKMLKGALAVLVVLSLAVVFVGCSKAPSGPKDEDALKAITSTVETAAKEAKLQGPVTIVQRGAQTPAGEWQIKAEYTLVLKDGKTAKEAKTFNLSSSINDMGVPVWTAVEAK